jgi:4-amino-4-deoxy-L-arabinose transferase-like glycosyltransferase
MSAAAHPILVNSASQPYSENLFFFLYAASILFFLIWFQTQQLKWALLSGISAGMSTLTRENGIILIAGMAIAILIAAPRKPKVWVGCAAVFFTALAVVAPWTIRNYEHFGVFVPVSSITGVDLKEGNNECVAPEGVFTPYWAEGPCPLVDEQVRAQLESTVLKSRTPAAVLRDRASRRVAAKFIFAHPATYAKLAFRRFWTTFLPYNPRGQQHFYERAVLVLYWILVFPAGILGTIIGFQHLETERVLLGLLILFQLTAIAAVLYWSDLRFRLGIDLLLGCFAGWTYAAFFQRYSSLERHPDFERLDYAA